MPPQAPAKIDPKTPGDYLEVMTKAVFQSGMSWRVIEAKWDGFREAFEGFDAEKVAGFGPDDVDRLAQDTRIVRNRRKIQATVDNADEILALDREHDGFRNYLRSHPSFEETVADLKRHFSFLGTPARTTSCTSSERRCPRTRNGWRLDAERSGSRPGSS
jgi:3-methyladenine DNA glycosylase Tag